MSLNRVMGPDKNICWPILAEDPYFLNEIGGYPVIMGRKTKDYLGYRLIGGQDVVITTSVNYRAIGAYIARSLPQAIAMVSHANKVFVIGGSRIFKSAMKKADRIIVHEFNAILKGHVLFPEIDLKDWCILKQTPWRSKPGDLMQSRVVEYTREKQAGDLWELLGAA